MNKPSRNRNLILVIAALLLTNIAVLAYFLWIKQPNPKKDIDKERPKVTMRDRLRDSIGFDNEQIAQFDKMREEQMRNMGATFEEMRKAKDRFFKLVSDTAANDSTINKASNAIAENQKALDVLTFNHFKKVRSLCTPEQQPKYDSMIQRIFRKMNKPMRGSGKK